jgi:hypothetical protein
VGYGVRGIADTEYTAIVTERGTGLPSLRPSSFPSLYFRTELRLCSDVRSDEGEN